jgi:hypothetical protein
MLIIAAWCVVLSLNTWLPRAIQGLLFLGGVVLLTWNLALDAWPRRWRKGDTP